jgi:cytochrome c553
MHPTFRAFGLWLVITLASALIAAAQAATPAELLAGYSAQAGAAPRPERGQQLFTSAAKTGLQLSCASCHDKLPTKTTSHPLSNKPLAALAPAFNPERFTDRDKVERYFRLNCMEVFNRECSAAEKADVLSWLMTLKP